MKTIEEKNRMIAEFMGFSVMKEDDFLANPIAEHLIGVMVDVAMKYHTSWEWLMPVVGKIEGLEDGLFDVNILKNGTQIFEYPAGGKVIVDNVADISFSDKIEHTYEAVVQFIEWYNENK